MKKTPFQIAVIDMQMPFMDGETLGRAMKADSRLASMKLVLLTSLGTRGDAKHFAEVGFDAYLTKPVRHLELKGVLSAVWGKEGEKLPAMRTIATRHTVRETQGLFADRKARILVAEDNFTNQQVALGILKKMGLRADAVGNGSEALKALETIPYDLVLMDVQMPEMDGMDATRRIRDPGSTVLDHHIPIVAMTAHAMTGDREKCLETGMDGYVAKPISPPRSCRCSGKTSSWRKRGETEDRDLGPGTRRQRTQGFQNGAPSLEPSDYAGKPYGRRGVAWHDHGGFSGGHSRTDRKA